MHIEIVFVFIYFLAIWDGAPLEVGALCMRIGSGGTA